MTYKPSLFRHPSGGPLISVLGEYRPWNYHKEHGGTGSTWPEHSCRIMDIKKMRATGYRYFERGLLTIIAQTNADAVALVPGHDPESTRSGMRDIVEAYAPRAKVAVGVDYLKRTALIDKLAGGGDRSLQVHLDSIAANEAARFRGKSILLVDDVLTSGNSIIACRKILMTAGAAKVHSLAFAQTTY